jgi:hypothetical protein
MAEQGEVFYKYTSAHVAKTVLATRRLRWSSPLLFNDPFDVTQELRLNFDDNALHRAVLERAAWLIEHGDGSTPVGHYAFGPVIRLAMRARPEVRKQMANEVRRGVREANPRQSEALKEIKDMWRAMVPTFRILCLSEVNDCGPMWHHYADKYRGVVMEFFAVKEVDSAFQMARPVLYQDAPSIADAYVDLFKEYLHVKNPEWSYEREWRIAVPGRRVDDAEHFGDYGFNARELTAIYLGPKCSPTDREDLLKLLTHGLQHVKAFQMEFDTKQARIVAHPIER